MTRALLRILAAVALGWAAAAAPACKDDYDCGERSLPGTEGCPCLPGDRCATDLVCAAGMCVSEAPGGDDGGSSSSTGTAGSDTGTAGPGSDTGTAGPGSDTGTAGSGASTGGGSGAGTGG